MLNQIASAMRAHRGLKGWTVREIRTRGEQLFAVPKGIEARRTVDEDQYVVDVLSESVDENGIRTCGTGTSTLLSGEDIQTAFDQAEIMSKMVHNEPYSVSAPSSIPDIPLVDHQLIDDPAHALDVMFSQVKSAAAMDPRVRLTSTECFIQVQSIHLINSTGIDASQSGTRAEVEWTLIAGEGLGEVESFASVTRRRLEDLDLKSTVGRHARQAVDLLVAEAPLSYKGPVVLRREALVTFLRGGDVGIPGTLHNLTSAEAKYRKMTAFNLGESIFRREPTGDPLTLWANRTVPFGTRSNNFDAEGIAAQRVELVKENRLTAFTANQRFADYLSIPATGQFGNIEVAPGSTPEQELLSFPFVEIVQFSWFYPDPLSGDFSSEIRLGYLCEGGKRIPFKGGLLVGNLLDALADARWSRETAFCGDYLGPIAVRFGQLLISGN